MSKQQKKAWCLLLLCVVALTGIVVLWAAVGFRATRPAYMVLALAGLVPWLLRSSPDTVESDERDQIIALRSFLIGTGASLGALLLLSGIVALAAPMPDREATVKLEVLPHVVIAALIFDLMVTSVAMLLSYRQGSGDG